MNRSDSVRLDWKSFRSCRYIHTCGGIDGSHCLLDQHRLILFIETVINTSITWTLHVTCFHYNGNKLKTVINGGQFSPFWPQRKRPLASSPLQLPVKLKMVIKKERNPQTGSCSSDPLSAQTQSRGTGRSSFYKSSDFNTHAVSVSTIELLKESRHRWLVLSLSCRFLL